MGTLIRGFAFLAAASLVALAPAQQPPDRQRTATLEERVTALEASLATLDTRLALERSRVGDDPGQTELALAARVQSLERLVDRLQVDMQRIQRVADDAARAANTAQRAAEQAARDALR